MKITKNKNKYMVESFSNDDGEYKYAFFPTIKRARAYARKLKIYFLDDEIAIYKVEGEVE